MTFYDFITLIVDFVGVRFLFWSSFLKHRKKYDFYDFEWPYRSHRLMFSDVIIPKPETHGTENFTHQWKKYDFYDFKWPYRSHRL